MRGVKGRKIIARRSEEDGWVHEMWEVCHAVRCGDVRDVHVVRGEGVVLVVTV